MKAAVCQAMFARFAAQNPNPTTELCYHSAFELLIAVLLSAQATDIQVNRATERLFAQANTPETMLALGEEGIKACIRTLNYYPTKARHIIGTCERLLALHKGQVPDERAALEALPGVGRKTANVVLNTAFKVPTMAVDTHIFRVANRTGLAQGATPLQVELQLVQVIPAQYLLNAHHWLLLHGRYVCQARKPQCATCMIRDLCCYSAKT